MADKTIGDLTQAESIGSEDLFILEQGGEAKKLKGSQLVKYAQDAVGAQVTAATQAAENAAAAKTGAESAQTEAQAARDAILNMIVEAITLEQGSPATVEKSLVDSVYNLTFGLPKGAKGMAADSFTLSLPASGWSGNAQTVSHAKLAKEGYAYIMQPAGGSYGAYSAAEIYADDVTVDGQITFHCAATPTTNVTVNVLKVEVAS